MARYFPSRAPSQFLQIENEIVAWDFDLTCATRLVYYDAAIEKQKIEALANVICLGMLGGLAVNAPREKSNEYERW
jgi:hypothetical protein